MAKDLRARLDSLLQKGPAHNCGKTQGAVTYCNWKGTPECPNNCNYVGEKIPCEKQETYKPEKKGRR